MRDDRRQGRGRRFGLGVGMLVCAALSVVGDEPSKAPTSPSIELPPPTTERIEADLLAAQKLIRNAQMRLESPPGLHASPKGEEQDNPPATVADECCQYHQEKIGAHLRSLAQIVEQLDARFARERNEKALYNLNEARGWLGTLSQGMAAFKHAPTTERATLALQGFIRPFNGLRASLRELESCCLPAAVPPANSKKPPAPAR